MHLLRLLRIFIPLLLLAAIVAGVVVVVTSRSDLQRSRKDVDTAWTPLRNGLDGRYSALVAANDAVRPIPGPLHQIVAQVAAAYGDWQNQERHGAGVSSEVVAANELESLGRRLVVAARAAPRLVGNTAALGLVSLYAAMKPPNSAVAFDAAVARFERERNRPARSLAARILGYKAIPAYDASGTPK
jgi:hypothetical protein